VPVGGICVLCPPMRRQGRNRSHRDDPVEWCQECRAQVCARHVRWDSPDGRWLCTRCVRRQGRG